MQEWHAMNFEQKLRRTAEAHGERDALVFPGLDLRWSYREFHAEVERVARALIRLGVEPREHVGIWATNLPQWVLLQFATARIGAVLVNINPAYRAHELQYVLEQADIATLFLTDRFKHSDYFGILAQVCHELADSPPGRLESASLPRLRRCISVKGAGAGMLSWDHFLALGRDVDPARLEEREAAVDPEDVVNVQYTSGTTGFPKGVQLTHRNLLTNATHVGERMGITPADRVCIPVPFYHCFGCVLGTLMCAVYGAAMVIPAEVFDPLATLGAIQRERCTALYGVPSMFIAQLEHPRFGEFDLSSLRTGIMAGSPCPIEVMRRVVERMGAREITIAYGLTEASPVITQTRTTDSLEHRVGTVGRPLAGLEVRIVDPDSGEEVEQGRQGELQVRGHCVMKGYYRQPEETAEAITPDGWLRSGDLATRTEDGFYKITGRIKDMVIRGGENLYPREIEEFLHTHPKIAEAQVVGLPDEKYGEELSVWLVLREGQTLTQEEVREFCKGRISHQKVPRYVFFVREYPLTVTGKVQKFRLREMGIEELGLEAVAGIETA